MTKEQDRDRRLRRQAVAMIDMKIAQLEERKAKLLTEDCPLSEHTQIREDWSEHTKKYFETPTAQTYLELRRADPDQIVQFTDDSALVWIDQNFEKLTDLGVKPDRDLVISDTQSISIGDFVAAFDACENGLSKVSLFLIEKILARDGLERSGAVHVQSSGKGIPNSLVNHIICMMLDALEWTDEREIPRDFLYLLRFHLSADKSREAKEIRRYQTMVRAALFAAFEKERSGSYSIRQVAREFEIEASTVKAWRDKHRFDEEVANFEEFASACLHDTTE